MSEAHVPSVDDLVLPVDTLERAIPLVAGEGVTVRSAARVAGGSINDARALTLSNGTRLFMKQNGGEIDSLFIEEARGLRALASGNPIPGLRVATPRAVFSNATTQVLLLDMIETGRGAKPASFGRALAELHRSHRSAHCGFSHDNHIGSTPQYNRWTMGWHDFFGELRLGAQIERAREAGRADAAMERACRRLIARLPELIPDLDDGGASLLHGDLWGGNVLADTSGATVLIDPAVYYGHREADLAMTALFGGFSDTFYDAYEATWPMVPGFAARRDIYNLYHLLNHLNLFGAGYASSCRAILAPFR